MSNNLTDEQKKELAEVGDMAMIFPKDYLDNGRQIWRAYEIGKKQADAAKDAQIADLVRERDAAVVLLKRISAWDMLDTAADGKYWRSEIEAATARLAKGRQE